MQVILNRQAGISRSIPRLILISDIGSNVIVAGTAIFCAPSPEEVITILKSTVDKVQVERGSK